MCLCLFFIAVAHVAWIPAAATYLRNAAKYEDLPVAIDIMEKKTLAEIFEKQTSESHQKYWHTCVSAGSQQKCFNCAACGAKPNRAGC